MRFLAVLREILRNHKPSWLDDHQGWQHEIGSLEDQIRTRNIRHGDAPTDADKRSETWREIHNCLEERAKARAMATVRDVLDPLLLRAILVCSAEQQQVDPSMINALRQLYKLGAHLTDGNSDAVCNAVVGGQNRSGSKAPAAAGDRNSAGQCNALMKAAGRC